MIQNVKAMFMEKESTEVLGKNAALYKRQKKANKMYNYSAIY